MNTDKITRDDLALYTMGAYDGDAAALEAKVADDDAARAMLAEEAELELLLRDAAMAGTFCTNCDDLIADTSEPVRCRECGAAAAPGGYTVERVLVANAHGRMYVARDADGTRVALKELAFVQSPSADTVAAFEREAKFLRALAHSAIPRFRAAFEEGSGVHTRYYLAQELVEGTALDARLDEHFYTEAEIIDIAGQVLRVLVYLQSLSPMVIHRDIKPANLLRKSDGSIAVVDFGAAHVQGTTAGSTSIGTFGYMPLEQLAGQVDATTDGYALGASLVHLLTRREPWRILTPTTLGPVNVSPALNAFLQKLVFPEPTDRYANAAASLRA
ncbi:MAG TPA: serine/threonine-protein kinase, partial [Kofleriaceae bacterium]